MLAPKQSEALKKRSIKGSRKAEKAVNPTGRELRPNRGSSQKPDSRDDAFASTSVIRTLPNQESAPRYIVGIGASAGGLEALRSLFSALKRAENISLVVVQHLAPQHRSRLVELIGHATRLPVKELRDGTSFESRTIYITPPNADVVVENGRLHLRNPASKIGPKPSVDLFLKSLADEEGERAIGIILSGTGSDGAQGIRAIKASGGMTFCQRLDSAKYDGMPRAAMQTGFVDFELTPEEIASQLSRLDECAARMPEPILAGSRLGVASDDPYHAVLSLLQRETKVDFTQYKQSTIRRRLERRIAATHCKTLAEYADYLRTRPDEARLLFQDILISVTSFFRDEAAFATLGDYLLGKVKKNDPTQAIRAWIVGCATGEEAYSAAILILEAMERAKKQLPFQIFATDLDEQAMLVARKGVYPRTSLAELPERIKARYFDPIDDGHYRIRDFVRDTIVFARHDVTMDPPFLKLDVISCRNVLIYFNSKLQERIIRTFHYALDMGGILFLGKSESTSAAEGLFEQADKNARVFYRSARKGDLPRSYSRTELNREAVLLNKDRGEAAGLELFHSMVASYAPDSAILDQNGHVKHLYGEANRYLNLPKGEPTVALTRLVPDRMALEFTALLHRASKTNTLARGHHKYAFGTGESQRKIQLSVAPLSHDNRREFLLSFDAIRSDASPSRTASSRSVKSLPLVEQLRALNEELAATREHLQTITEEHETSNEELQALNEELQSANEELQSTNEELETTNEELQSTNEELTTLNQEINVKSTELQVLNQRLQAIQNAIFYPLLVVDNELRLMEYNPAARHLFRVADSDRNHSIKHLAQQYEILPALRLAEESIVQGRDARIQLKMTGRDFEVRIQLFRGIKGQVDGAVLSFVDISELMQALQQSRLHRERFEAILDHTPALVTVKDTQGCYLFANRRFSEVLGKPLSEILDKTDEEVFGTTQGELLRERDYEVIKTRKAMRFEDCVNFGEKSIFLLSSRFPLLDERRKAHSVCTISLDITDRILHEKQLELFRRVISESNMGLAILEGSREGLKVSFVSDRFAHRLAQSPSRLKGLDPHTTLERLLGNSRAISIAEILKKVETEGYASFTLNMAEEIGSRGPRETGPAIGNEREDWVELKASVMHFGEPASDYMVLMLFDINEQMRMRRMLQANQDEMARFSKLATLGELAAGISHEINTPLNVISAKAQLLERLADRDQLDPQKLRKTTSEIGQMVRNIAAVIQGLKSLSGNGADTVESADVVGVVREAAGICDLRLQRFGVKLFLELPERGPLIQCNPVQIMQIFINLLNNAMDAVSELADRWIRIEFKDTANQVEIFVIDSGKGIDASLAEKIMTPFFTTKGDKNGTGLGLSLSRTIARKHGGDLSLLQGTSHTCFKLNLPKRME